MQSSFKESHGNRTHTSGNFLTQEGARHLARNIVSYWVSKDYRPQDVNVQVVRDDKAEAYWVRSNLRNGTPPGRPSPSQST